MSYNFNKWVALGNGIASAGIGLGTVVTPPLIQSISHFWNWQGALRTICAFCIVTAVCGALIRPSKKELYFVENRRRQTKESKQHPDSQMELGNKSTVTPITFKRKFIRRPLTYLKVKSGISLFWDYPRFLVVVIAYACIACGYNSSLVFFHSKLVQDDEIPKIQASTLTSAIGVGGIVGRAISGAIIDCNVISRRSLYGVSSLFCSFFYYANPFVSLYPLLFVISVWFGLFSGIASCCPGYCARVCIPDEKLATGIGFIFLVEGVGTLLGVFFVGLIRDLTEDFTLSFVMCGTIFVVAAVIVFVDQVYFGLKDRKSQGQEKGDERNDKAETSGQEEGESEPTRNTDKDARENFAYEEDGDIEKYDTVRVHQEETQLSSENELVYTKESIL
ncbi:Monocarboxylate transporter 12 [Holothuria leucospilota]|uniref:Monocarboxylate transporter 12 n=1 Tax=Holothuria leucospilota TaxID=206669 RepID=A0A9Q1CRP4_HOLLE|nr:Monocarboxylate transporter 12 [Holothuria leucospilota]